MSETGTGAQCDVVIVGGGPAGSTLARELTRGGLDVVVVDRATFPRDKVCAGWITPAVIEELELDVDDYRREDQGAGRTFQPITGFRAGMLGARIHDVQFDHPVSYGIRRCELDEYLLRRSGARLLLGRRLEAIERRSGEWQLRIGADAQGVLPEDASGDKATVLRAPLLVGAGGHGCPVARYLDRQSASRKAQEGPGGGHAGPEGSQAKRHLVVAQEIEFELTPEHESSCAVRADMPELYFTPDLAGYGWCFRKGGFLNVGLGRLDRTALTQHVSEFVHWLREQERIAFELPGTLKGHAYLIQGHRDRNPVGDGALLIGDAAGLAYPKSGEGIRPAIESSLLAAPVLLAARGCYRVPDLVPYREALEQRFERVGGEPKWSPPVWLRSTAASALFRSPWFARKVLIERWFLNRGQAPLPSRTATAEAGIDALGGAWAA